MPPLTSRERVARVLAGELPDRVPVLMQNFQNTAYLAGMTLHEFCRSGERMAEAQLAAWERFGYDVIDLENGTAALAEACGCEVEYPEHEPPRVVRPVLRSLDEVGRLRSVDPARDGMLPELLDATRRVQAGVAGRACVKGEADQGPFDLAALLMGPEPFLMALMQPEQHADVHRLLEYCFEQVRRYALAQAAAGADFTAIGDSTAGPDVCSPRIYRQFAHPYEVRLAADLAAHGVRLVLHICGNTTAIMADIATTGATMIEFDYKADMARCRAAAQDVTLVGNVDPSGVMALGTSDQILAECRRAIEVLGKHGRFILSPGCTLPATTPPENVEAMMEAARTFGQYPEGWWTDKSRLAAD
jgi:uroporphyrinogen decarboxylase